MPLSLTARRLFAAFVMLLLAACASAPTAENFSAWSERFAADWMRQTPEFSTNSRYFAPEEQALMDARFSAIGDEARRARRELAQRGLRELEPYLAGTLSGAERGQGLSGAERGQGLSGAERAGALTMRWSLQRVLSDAPFEDHSFAFAQTFGLQVRYQSLFADNQPLRRAADVPAYLARLAAMGQRIDDTLALQRRASERGFKPPRFIAERARTQLRMLDGVADLDAAARAQALAQARQHIGQGVRPAWARVAAFLDELLPVTTPDAGLWRLPRGEQAYAQALANNTTTSLSADEIHTLGLREVARIEADMDRLLRGLGRSQGSVKERMAALQAQQQPAAVPDPRPALLQRYDDYVRDAERRAAPLFNLRPKAPIEVRRVGPLTERTAAAHYTTPTPDGARPGLMWVPMPGPSFNILGMRTLAVHEAVPGHHFQIALQQETASLPRWRQMRVFSGGSAHSEGWALYAERLAIEEGWYEGDVLGLLGAWDAQLFRARRLVVDTGLHARRWSREQAIEYGIGAQEVERYVVNPGQATAYMVGMLRILQLREQARTALGARFSLRDFHDLVLSTGSVPLDVLGEVVDGWVRRGGGRVG
jgi:uncharacterized protein (DUF885 family)